MDKRIDLGSLSAELASASAAMSALLQASKVGPAWQPTSSWVSEVALLNPECDLLLESLVAAEARGHAMRARLIEEPEEPHASEMARATEGIRDAEALLKRVREESLDTPRDYAALARLPGVKSTFDLADVMSEIRRLSQQEDPDGEMLLDKKARQHADRWAVADTPMWQREYLKYLGEHRAQLKQPLSEAWKLVRSLVYESLSWQRERLKRIVESFQQDVERRVQCFLNVLVPSSERARCRAILIRAGEVARAEEHARSVASAIATWGALADLRGLAVLSSPSLTDEDRQLCQMWSGRGANRDYDRARCESARRAELAMLRVYSRTEGRAEDLSDLQRTRGWDERWKCADIGLSRGWVDIKNSRKSYTSPESYSEYCVPQFKRDRCGQDVIVSGVLSPYFGDSGEALLWLGETSEATIQALVNRVSSDYLTFARSHDGAELIPPWLFDYPSSLYLERNRLIEHVRAEEFSWPCMPCPVSLAVLVRSEVAASGQGDLWDEVRHLRTRLTCSEHHTRPLLFLHVIDRYCATARAGRAFPAAALKEIFGPVEDAPLGVLDPLCTISALIEVLCRVSARNVRLGAEFTAFKLTGLNTLRGLTPSGEWRTIVAYCGGWRRARTGAMVRCGKNPLFLGEDDPCRRCGRLACSVCGFCMANCPECKPRQEAYLGGWVDGPVV